MGIFDRSKWPWPWDDCGWPWDWGDVLKAMVIWLLMLAFVVLVLLEMKRW